MREPRILFLRDWPPFVEVLEEQDYDVVVVEGRGRSAARQVAQEDPDLIVLVADGLDCDGFDPVEEVPETHRDRVLAVPGDLEEEELLDRVERRLRYFM